MPSLSSLIVQRQVATIAEVEQAIARQVIHGGDLVTNLLEVSPHCEHSLTRVLAESLGIPSVPPGRLPAPDNEVLDIVPVETALRYAIFPLRLSAKTLVIATSERLKPTALHDLAYTLGLDLSQVAAPLIRIREGIAAHYGVPLEPRQLRLVQKLDSVLDGMATHPTRAYAASLPDSPSILPSNLGSGVSTPPAADEPNVPTTRRKGSTLEMEEVREGGSRKDTSIDVHAEDDEVEPLLEPQASKREVSRVAFQEEELPPQESEPAFISAPPPDVEPGTPSPSLHQAEAPLEHGANGAPAYNVRDTYADIPAMRPDLGQTNPDLEPEAPQSLDWSESDIPPAQPQPEPAQEAGPAPAPEPHPKPEPAPAPIVVERAHEEPVEPAPTTDPHPSVEPPEADELLPSHPPSFPPGDSPRPPGIVNKKALATLLKREIGAKRRTTAKSARKKGPFSRVDAERELEAARSGEEVLDTFFAFGSQFFEYSALFVVHGDLVEGRDAWGPGADHLRVLGFGVPLDLPSTLSNVRRDGNVALSRFDELDLDRELLRDLERTRARPAISAVVPLTVKRRAVAMLFGDDGDSDVTLASLGDLLGFSALASSQLERVALAKKAKGGPFAGLVAPRAQPSSVEALARAFSLPIPTKGSSPALFARRETPSSGTPVHLDPKISPGATSVHPPPPITNRYEDEEDEVTLARKRDRLPDVSQEAAALEARPDPAYAETEIPSFALLRNAPRGGPKPASSAPLAESVSPAAVSVDLRQSEEPPVVSAASHVTGPPHIVTYSERPGQWAKSGPPPPVQDELVEEVLAATRERSSRPADAFVEGRGSQQPSRPASAGEESVRPPDATRARQFRPPIPRVDDEEDASEVVAQNVEEGYEAGHMRHEPEPFGQDGREYHLVPRPADARLRGETADMQALLDRATAGGLEGEEALSELQRRAEQEFPRLIERFPGPLLVDRFRARADLPPASECGPLLKVLVTMRRGALPFMTVRSTSNDTEQRFWATHVLGELLLPEASNAILPRLFDEDASVRRVARRAAQALASAGAPGEPLKHSLAHTMKNNEEPMQRRLLAIEALSDMRVPSVVPIIIPALTDASEPVVEAARTALMVLTRQDLGRNPQVWTAWWQMHQHEHRIEWLIQALTHDTPSIRRTAGDELKSLTREYFGYYDDLPAKERERAQSRYKQWWDEEGRYRFR